MNLGMMKSKLIRDAFLEMPAAWNKVEPVPNPAVELPEGFVLVPDTVYSISHGTTWPFKRQIQRPFRWLPYIPGKVTCMPLGGQDILTLTGKMTGRWVVVFILESTGQRFVGHIGTSWEWGDLAGYAKWAWRNAVEKDLVTPWKAYNPVDPTQISLDPDRLDLKGEAAEFYGAIQPAGRCSTVLLTCPKGGSNGTRRVAAVVGMRTTTDAMFN
jgi:hypothetical protein